MAGPKFPLETLLEHRRRQEEARQLELTTRLSRLEQEQQGLAALHERRDLVVSQLRDQQMAQILDLPALDRSVAYAATLEQAIGAQEQVVVAVVAECDQAREELIQASRASKVVTKLRDSWQAECRQGDLRREDKALAETAIAQFHRRSRAAEGA